MNEAGELSEGAYAVADVQLRWNSMFAGRSVLLPSGVCILSIETRASYP